MRQKIIFVKIIICFFILSYDIMNMYLKIFIKNKTMLHIVKQFMSALTMGLKFGLESGNNHVDTTENNTDSQSKELQKQAMLDYIDSLNTLEDDRLDSADSVFDAQDLVKSELADILVKLGFQADAEAIQNGILISEIKQKIEENFANKEVVKSTSKEEMEVLSKQANISQKLSLMSQWDLSNLSVMNWVTDKTSPQFARKDAQTLLVSLWYDISYYSKSKDMYLVGSAAVDGILGSTYSKAMKNLQSDLGVTQTWNLDKNTVETLDKLISAQIQKNLDKKLAEDAAAQQAIEQSTHKETITSQSNYSTVEKGVKTSKEEFMWIEFDKLTKNEILKEVHQGALNDLLAKVNVSELAQNLRIALKTDNLSTFVFTDYFVHDNYSDAKNILKDAWYEIKGGYLETVEALGVIGTIDGVAKTQEVLKNVDDYNEKLKIIFDYNADGLLDSKTAFYTQEREMFDAVKDEQGFENVLKNLGYENLDQFNAEFENNYYSARENFKTQLARVLHSEYVISPNLMIQDPQAREKLNSSLQATADQADESIRENAKLQEIQEKYPELSQQLQKKVLEQTQDVYLQHLSASFGEYNGAAVTFNVQEVTDSILDTASFGIINGVAGFQVGKEVYVSEDGKLKVWAGLVNFYPYISANYKINEGNIGEIQNLFQRNAQETGYNVNVAGALSIAPVAGVQVEKMDEDTAEGIEKMTAQMSDMIDTVLDSDSFDELNLSADNKDAYDRVKALQNASGDTQVAREQLKQGIINNYQRELFRDAESFNVTGVSLGFILKENYLPVLGIHGEIKSQKWQKVNTIDSFEYATTQTTEASNFATIEKMEKLDADLSTYREGFSEKTRWNSGALWVLTPTNSLEQRWESLVDLADGPKALRDINFSNFLEYHKDASDDQKLAIISKVASWMREGGDIKNAQSLEEVIKIDSQRREAFNTNFGFDASKYAQAYYNELSHLDNLSATSVHGTGFDAVSTLHVEGKHKISWVDVLHGNLDAIADKNGDMLMIEISDKNDTMAFANTIAQTNPDLAQLIEDGKVTLYFYKDPDGFDDRILPVENASSVTKQSTLGLANGETSVWVYQAVNEVTAWSVFGTEKQDDKKLKANSEPWDDDVIDDLPEDDGPGN